MSSTKYKKRPGTSGISGQLYETNLISLILFKLHHDKSIEDFALASNMDDIGAFDDICLRVKINGHEKSIFAFVQAKHKEDDDTFLNYELFKHFYVSYVKVKQNFYTSKDVFFKEKFDDTDCVFILYTNAKYCDDSINVGTERSGSNTTQGKQARIPYVSRFADKLNDLISTGEKGSQAEYTDEDLEYVNEIIVEEEIITLSEHFAKFLNEKTNQSMNIMLDDYMLQYHAILAKSIVDISKVQTDVKKSLQWRELTFNSNFFDSEAKIVKMLRKNIYAQVFKTQVTAQVNKKKDKKVKQNTKSKDTAQSDNSDELIVNNLISEFLLKPSARTLSPLIGIHIIYISKSDQFEFTSEKSTSEVEKLEQIKLSSDIIEEAEELAARNILMPLKLKVPTTFGNLDLAIGGNEKKIEKRLGTLTEFFDDLCKTSKLIDSYETVIIDESVGEGFLSLNGGIGSAVGNLLVYDKVTKLLMFTENPELLSSNAQILYTNLSKITNNLFMYRFDVKALVKFPKLVFDFTDDAKLILKKVVIYEKQGNHKRVADKLKTEIEKHHITNQHNIPVRPETISISYHHQIQIWWMSLKAGTYLTKFKDKVGSFQEIYQRAINNIVTEPQISAMQTTFYMSNLNYFRYKFSSDATESLTLLKENITIIATDIPTLTTIKIIQCLRDKYSTTNAVLDLEYMLNLNENEVNTLNSEIESTDKVLIVLCNKINNNKFLHRILDQIPKATESRKMIVIANNGFIETVQEYFPSSDIINDDKQSLVFLTEESQKDIIEQAQVIFQGEKVSLGLLVDDKSVEFIKGAIFNKIVRNETITIGKSLSSSSYDEIRHLYVDRRVCQTPNNDDNLMSDDDNIIEDKCKDNIFQIRSFNDINEAAVLVTAKPGMGKSTLLTHLSLKTKEHDMEKNKIIRWIERINLLDHSKIFYNWQKDKTNIDTLETLKLICQAILKNSLLDHSKVFYNWHKDTKEIDTLETLKFICQSILKNSNIRVCIEEIDSKVYLKECTGDAWATFELNMFLHFYNERKLILAFDGFDEICPHYKDSVLKLFDAIRNYPQKNKMWVTSRPYTEILPDLETVLGKPYELEFINEGELEIYLNKYWQDKIILENFNHVQFKRIFDSPDEFLGNLPSVQDQDAVYINLQRIYYHLRKYLYSTLSTVDKDNISKSLYHTTLYSSELIVDPSKPEETLEMIAERENKNKVNKFLGTPLLLYLLVDYFINLIDDISSERFKGNINVFVIYNHFIETKLKKILFQDKLKMDVYMPGIITRYEQDLTDCIIMHKKLAAYVIFQNSFLSNECRLFEFEDMRPFNEEDTANFEAMVSRFKSGTERTGLISSITPDNIPVFIHRTFAEYFASEYICDIFKSNKFDTYTKKLLFITIHLLNTNDVMPWICRKREFDSELRRVLTRDFITAIVFSICRPLFNHRNWSIEQFIRIMASSTKSDYDDIRFVPHAMSLLKLKGDDRNAYIIKFQDELMMKMKPELKKHFTTPRWPVNSAANCSTRFPSTPLRKHLHRHLKKGFPNPFGAWFDD